MANLKYQNILVVGDWVIDENWVAGIHQSSLSSRTGKTHFRGLNPSKGATFAFCGAGLTVEVLHKCFFTPGNNTRQRNASKEIRNKIIGIGIWHKEDAKVLSKLFDDQYRLGLRADMIIRDRNVKKYKREENIELINLAKDIESFGTTRVIRIFQQVEDGDIHLVQRIDWEHVPDHEDWEIMKKKADKQLMNRVENLMSAKEGKIQAVVIKDLKKGVISRNIVEAVIDISKNGDVCKRNVPWFVITKDYNPDWMDLLKKVNLKLVFFPRAATEQKMFDSIFIKGNENENNILSRWITQSGLPSYGAVTFFDEQLANLTSSSKKPKRLPLFVVQIFGNRLLIYDSSNSKMLVTKSNIERPGVCSTDLPFYGVFVGALIGIMVANERYNSKFKLNAKKMIEWSYIYTYGFQKRMYERLNPYQSKNGFLTSGFKKGTPIRYEGVNMPSFSINDIKRNRKLSGIMVEFSKTDEEQKWKDGTIDAFNYFFMIDNDHEVCDILDLPTNKLSPKSRSKKYVIRPHLAMTEVKDYICLTPHKRRALARLVLNLNEFKRGDKSRSESCLIQASPGSGKSYLARCLANYLDFEYRKFNITQMLSKDQLFDCFDEILTTQAQNIDIPILVFFDEINAEIEGQPVYPTFLAPLEEGRYIRGEKAFHILPCVWIFAQTRKGETEPKSSEDKVSDFYSRLSLPEIDLSEDRDDVNDDDNDHWSKLERVYAGVRFIQSRFGYVEKISLRVLRLFYELGKSITFRQLELFIQQFKEIQYSHIHLGNIPFYWLTDKEIMLDKELLCLFKSRQREEKDHPSRCLYAYIDGHDHGDVHEIIP